MTPFKRVLAMITSNPAAAIRRSDTLGSLAAGRSADVSVFRLVDEPTVFSDGEEDVAADQRLVPVGCLRAGEWIPTPPLTTYASAGKTWVKWSANEDLDW